MGDINRLSRQPVVITFFQYLIPSLIGMTLMSVNIVVDGIFVGHGVGSVALASINIAVPVFSIILSIALLIGVGGGALYSMAIGAKHVEKAQRVFTTSMLLVTIITVMVSTLSLLFIENIALFFGANEDTLAYVLDYMTILLLFSLFMSWETSLSIFVRNDGNPKLAMNGLVITSILNILLNYWMIFILKLEVIGAALATAISIVIGLLILSTHFLKKGVYLKFVKFKWHLSEVKDIFAIGIPSFLTEAGMGVFVIAYNLSISFYAGTNGLAAFSVINYVHTFMLLAFIGVGSSIQPMISYYYGAKLFANIKETIKIAERTAFVLGALFLLIGFVGAKYIVLMFGVTSEAIMTLATNGIKLFFMSYLFMGVNFVYVTYFQATGYIRPSLWLTVFRGFIILLVMIFVLPYFLGVNGVWLAYPVTEAVITGFLFIFVRKKIFTGELIKTRG